MMKKSMFKKISKSALGLVVGTSLALNLSAQEQVEGFVHEQSAASDYVYPTDPQVLEKLDRWQDQKFGVLLHWGLYSVPGIVESWSICSEDEDWISRKNGLPVIDLHSALDNKPGLFPDKIHPNEAGARIMAREVYRALTE